MSTLMIVAPLVEQQEEPKQPTVYRVPEANYDKLCDQIKRLQRRAVKLGSGEIALKVIEQEDIPEYTSDNGAGDTVICRKPGQAIPYGYVQTGYRRFFLITVSGDRPKLPGWEFLGTIDAVFNEEGALIGNILRSLPGVEVPVHFRTAAMSCDHCCKKRRWSNTFIVKNTLEGTYFQVGRQCLRDFLGHANPEFYASYAELLLGVGELLDSAEDEGWGDGKRIPRFGVLEILRQTAAIVRVDGWRPRSKYDINNTASTLSYVLFAKGNDRKRLDEVFAVTDEDRTLAEETQDWLEGLSEREDLGDYLHNLSILARSGVVQPKSFGLLCSAIANYQRTKDVELLRKQERENNKASVFVGEVKKRLTLTLTLHSKRYIPGEFGTTTLCKFRDDKGNVIIWWASGEIELPEGAVIKAKATVKKHEVYKEIQQTTVTRLTVIEELELPLSKAGVLEQAEERLKNLVHNLKFNEETRGFRSDEEALALAKQHPGYLELIARAEKCKAA